jgi:glycogen operon protein
VFRRSKFLTGREVKESGLPDVWWFRPDGRRMTQKDWQRDDAHTLGVFLNGREIPERTPDGLEVVDDSFLLLFNAYGEPIRFTLPTRRFGARWKVEIATGADPPEGIVQARAQVTLEGRSLALFRRV